MSFSFVLVLCGGANLELGLLHKKSPAGFRSEIHLDQHPASHSGQPGAFGNAKAGSEGKTPILLSFSGFGI